MYVHGRNIEALSRNVFAIEKHLCYRINTNIMMKTNWLNLSRLKNCTLSELTVVLVRYVFSRCLCRSSKG